MWMYRDATMQCSGLGLLFMASNVFFHDPMLSSGLQALCTDSFQQPACSAYDVVLSILVCTPHETARNCMTTTHHTLNHFCHAVLLSTVLQFQQLSASYKSRSQLQREEQVVLPRWVVHPHDIWWAA